jgi:hypothetical protein
LNLNPCILVFVDDTPYGKSALKHAKKLSQIFDTEIQIIDLHKKTDLKSVFSATEVNHILCFVMPVGQSKKLAFFNTKKARKWISKSRVPVFAVGSKEPEENDYQQIILPLDIHCQEKELALWASYFPANFQKNCSHISKENIVIHLVYNQYKDTFLRQKVQNNIEFVKKMFDNLEVLYRLHSFTNVGNIHTFGLQFAKKTGNSVLLYLMPEHFSIIDIIFGPVSNKLLGNKEQIPVLCLNPREDIFVLCR